MNLATFQFIRKRVDHNLARTLCDDVGNGNTDRMLRTGLRNQCYRDPGILERSKQPIRRSGNADHARTLEIDQCHATNCSDALDVICRGGARFNATARVLRLVAVSNYHRNVVVDCGTQRLRMNNLGAEVCQLHRFIVG